MTDLKIPLANGSASNVDNIEEYLKNKYKFLNEKSPYTQGDFIPKSEEKSSNPFSEQEKPKKNQDETLDITIFRDLQLNNRDPDNFLKKYENQDEGVIAQKTMNSGLTSDPKLNKLLFDVENIVQKATGKVLNNDQILSSDPKFMQGNRLGLSNKRNADIENQEIRAYLNNLGSKLNIIVPKKNTEEKENAKGKCKREKNNREELQYKGKHKEIIKNKGDSSFCSSDSETSPSFHKESSKKQPNSTVLNNKNYMSKDNEKKFDEQNTNKISCSPTKTSYTRTGRSNSRHIFEKFNCADEKIKEYSEAEKYLNQPTIRGKTKFESDTTVFCVNCEEFVHENKIDEHSKVCHKIINHRVPSSDNHYNSKTSSSNEQNKTKSNVFEIKKINENLNKITSILLQKFKYFENLSFSAYGDSSNSQQIAIMLNHFLQLTLNLIHTKDVSMISQISKNLHEIFINMSEMNNTSPDILQILQKIKQYCKIKYEILDPNHDYYNAISSNKNLSYNCNPVNYQKYQNMNNMSNFISDNISQITGISKNKTFADMNSPSHNSNHSELTNNNSKLMKKKFFNLAIATKLALPKGHPGHAVNLSDLFLECLQIRLPENEWEDFLDQKLNLNA